MEINLKNNVTGFDELFRAMDELAEEIGKGKTDKIWKKSLGYAMKPVLEDAKALAPRDTGQLADHIYLKIQRPQGRDKSSKYYKGEMFMARVTVSPKREDTITKTTLNKKGKFQTYSANLKPVALSQEFGNRRLQNSEFGTAARGSHPFMRPALEKNYQNVIDRLGTALWAELTWGKYSKG
jgi:HK97 gp10 family phage protein